jgi:hypothetical protein
MARQIWIFAVALLCLAAECRAADAQAPALTLGITMNCPYGLAG